jgi:hypothetical protein
MDLFKFQVRVGADYFVGCAVQVFVFDGYVYYSYARSANYWGSTTDIGVDFNIRVLNLGLQIKSRS